MGIHVTFDPTDAEDVAYVLGLINGEEEKAAPAPKKAAAKKAPEPEPEVEEEVEDGEPTMQAAIDRATELVGEGRTADVKGALAQFGVKRVSELEESQVAEFLAALEEDSPV